MGLDGHAALPVVVGGCHRSGTSLVRRLLNAHSAFHCGPEVPFFRDLVGDYFADPLHHLRFTTAARSLVTEDVLLDVLGRAFVTLHERAALAAGKARWADKAPENALHLVRWQQLLGNGWVYLHVVRNPLDTLASMDEAGFPLTLPQGLPGRIDHYVRYVGAGLDFLDANPLRSRLVVYEDLVDEPHSSLTSLMTWLGADLEQRQLAFNEVEHGSGLEDPKVAATTQVHSHSVGRPSRLTREERELVAQMTASTSARVVATAGWALPARGWT